MHFAHPKGGTTWFWHVLFSVGYELKMKFQWQSPNNHKQKEDADIFLVSFYPVDIAKIRFDRGSHLLRDPRDLIISGYFYHLWTNEEYFLKPRKAFGEKSYQEILCSLNKEDGILFEMRYSGIFHTKEMLKLHQLNDPRILEIKYEDFILHPKKNFKKLFRWYGFNKDENNIALKAALSNHFQKVSGRKLGEEKREEHLRRGLPGDWKNYFTEKHKEEFKKLLGDSLIELGYEKNNNW